MMRHYFFYSKYMVLLLSTVYTLFSAVAAENLDSSCAKRRFGGSEPGKKKVRSAFLAWPVNRSNWDTIFIKKKKRNGIRLLPYLLSYHPPSIVYPAPSPLRASAFPCHHRPTGDVEPKITRATGSR